MATLHPRHPTRRYTDPPHGCSDSWHASRSATVRDNLKDDVPWHHMAHTYTWVVENASIASDRSNRKTEQWVLQQQMFLATGDADPRSVSRVPPAQRKVSQNITHEIEAERWMRHGEEVRRRAVETERKARLVDEEIRRIETKMRIKREEERRKMAIEKQRMQVEAKERDRQKQLKADKAMLDAWYRYEERWKIILCSSDNLTFSSIPWPMLAAPSKTGDISPQAVVSFLFSPVHSEKQTHKDRVRRAQLRWHPDRFQRVLDRVKEEDKAQVREGVGIVARSLNDVKLQK